ncbi:MAG: hypothetical protein ACW98U_03365 [Candidatus Thorarchaeota archaeon]|jgi:hypothetical protein
MKRDDPLLLPICQKCGKYKGVGSCSNPQCQEEENSGEDPFEEMKGSKVECSQCKRNAVVSCSRCNRGFCEIHGNEEVIGKLSKWDQRIGTCTICNLMVCENCWILNGNGLITCLIHYNGHPHHEQS